MKAVEWCSWLVVATMGLGAASPLLANPIGVKVSAQSLYETDDLYPGLGTGCNDPLYPHCNATITNTGATSASALVSESGTTGQSANPADTTSDAFASVSASEGHIGLSLSADAEGIGNAQANGSASWNDVLTVSSSTLAKGEQVHLVATLSISAELVGLGGPGSVSVQACFQDANQSIFQICTLGQGSNTAPLQLPATVTQPFTATVGETIALAGNAIGTASAAYSADPDFVQSSWSMVATDSAHFSITSITQGVDLTLASGCSITDGYGCDSPPSGETPEPPTLALLLGGGLLLAGLGWRRRTLIRAASAAVEVG